MKAVSPAWVAVVLALLGGFAWYLLRDAEPPASWLRVEASPTATSRQPFVVRVTLLAPGEHSVNVDLHGWTPREHRLGAVSQAPAQLLRSGQSATFTLPVPERQDLQTIRAVIFLSPDGRWASHTHVALTKPIEVTPPSTTAASTELKPMRAHDDLSDPAIPRRELTGLRLGLGLLWLILAAWIAQRWRRLPTPVSTIDRRRRAMLFFCAVAAILTAAVEFTQLEAWLDHALRNFAVAHDFYEQRIHRQKIGALVVLALLAVAFVQLPRLPCRRLLGGLLLNVSVGMLAIFSLHETDALLYATVGGVPVEQLLKLGAVTLSVWGLREKIDAP